MDFPTYKSLVKQINIGKQLPDAVYVHQSAISELPEKLAIYAFGTANKFSIDDSSWNILKLSKRDFKIAYLNYPTFDYDSYPSLHTSYQVDLVKETSRSSDYSRSENPPILHRKETFVLPSYPLYELFKDLTEEGVKIGLYSNTKRIGFRNNWEKLIRSKGYFLNVAGRLQALSERISVTNAEALISVCVERHKTAIDRNSLSAPMKTLARHNYLTGNYSVLDYGCGKGDDVSELEAHGLNVVGWDPKYRPKTKRIKSDLVNLGFVLNVIEDRNERDDTLIQAWSYTKKILVVGVMVANENLIAQLTPYKDGIITSRNTFQKYYTQGEIKQYLASTLDETPIAVGQGIFFLFKDKIEEQIFLSERQHTKRNWTQKTRRIPQSPSKEIARSTIENNIDLFSDYWDTTLELGRTPSNSEFEFSEQIRRLCGSHIKAHSALLDFYGEDTFHEAASKRKEDLIVYFALGMFERRRAQTKLPNSIKLDIKAFFSSYTNALEEARDALFSVGEIKNIGDACIQAHEQLKSGFLDERHSFTFHKKYLGELPPILRIYVGCATQLYGDIDEFELIKAHITSGKVSLMRYDDWAKDEPLLVERVKIKLRELDIDFFDYVGEFEPPPLINKSAFV